MRKPYLVTRANIEDRDFKKGIDSIVKFQYMGSAEYEFGALPDSLDRVREDIDKYVSFDYEFEKAPGKVVTVFCNEDIKYGMEVVLESLANGEYTLKEYSDLDNFVHPEKNWEGSTDFWWDIENDWMCWVKSDSSLEGEEGEKKIQIYKEFKNKFDKIINKAPEKKVQSTPKKEVDMNAEAGPTKIDLLRDIFIIDTSVEKEEEKTRRRDIADDEYDIRTIDVVLIIGAILNVIFAGVSLGGSGDYLYFGAIYAILHLGYVYHRCVQNEYS